MRNIKLTLAYDGTHFSGWQLQPNAVTIQGILKEALEKLCKHDIKLNAAGRTDAGVHARAQVANFFTDVNIPVASIPKAIQGLIPDDIVVYKAEEVAKDFHARYSATAKTYRYTIDNSEFPDVFMQRFAVHIRRKLNIGEMQKAASFMIGKHDFTSFCAAHGSSKTFERTINQLNITSKGQFITIEINADGFLYHMVRNIAGLLIEVGQGKIEADKTKLILEAQDRKQAPATASAKGLCLWEVFY